MKRYLMSDLWMILVLCILTIVIWLNISTTKYVIKTLQEHSNCINSMEKAQHEIYDYLIVKQGEEE